MCSAYDPVAFKTWASRGICPGIPPVRQLFQTLKGRGFRVFLISGRDQETLGATTAANLAAAGFSGYDRLIMRYGSSCLSMNETFFFFFFLSMIHERNLALSRDE